jgi:glycosyltransferase involved in cell wall biosynthesis
MGWAMTTTDPAVTIIIPAANEAAVIGRCLAALIASDDPGAGVEVIVVANGCTDLTVQMAKAQGPRFAERGWTLSVLDLPSPGKPGALNAGDAAARGAIRAYLDADVTVSPGLIRETLRVLNRPEGAYASGRITITADSAVSRRYARIWARVPFMARGVPGCGYFAMNAAGRARWGDWPTIISDDTFARLQFTPAERHLVDAPYDWPVVEGWEALVKVRRRQDMGVAEVARLYPHLMANDDKLPLSTAGKLRLALTDPSGFYTYTSVAMTVRKMGPPITWDRGR